MNRRESWRGVLDSEMEKWSALACDELVSRLDNPHAYQVEVGSVRYQIEVEMLENTDEYVHVMIAVDDGTLPAAILPLTDSFICRKSGQSVEAGSSPTAPPNA
jgi:hypothetical protein